MPTAQINGIELYYEVHGNGPAVVFAHGAGGNHLSWWQQVLVFARQLRMPRGALRNMTMGAIPPEREPLEVEYPHIGWPRGR
jgi:pimeloyl-ACP methyl ester carboxylesterase